MESESCDISNNISIFCQVHSCKQIRSSRYGSNVINKFVAGNCRWLTPEERIEVLLMSGERSFRVIAADFNNRHPEDFQFHTTLSGAKLPNSEKPGLWLTVCLVSSTFWTATPCLVSHSPSVVWNGKSFWIPVVKICSYDAEISFSRDQNDLNFLLRGQSYHQIPEKNVL